MNNKVKDLTGMKFNRLTVVSFSHSKRKTYWNCICDCGNPKVVRADNLQDNSVKSCGCLHIEGSRKRMKEYASKENRIEFYDATCLIYPTNSEIPIIIDSEDYDLVNNYTWYIGDDGYARSNFENKKTLLMHKIITKTSSRTIIDHITNIEIRGVLIPRERNNMKSNLRIVTSSQNSMNSRMFSNNTSGYKGVSFSKDRNLWRAYIGIDKKHISLGYFENIDDAIKARVVAEEKYFGEYSYTKNNEY